MKKIMNKEYVKKKFLAFGIGCLVGYTSGNIISAGMKEQKTMLGRLFVFIGGMIMTGLFWNELGKRIENLTELICSK